MPSTNYLSVTLLGSALAALAGYLYYQTFSSHSIVPIIDPLVIANVTDNVAEN
jgi:hypothetical protein